MIQKNTFSLKMKQSLWDGLKFQLNGDFAIPQIKISNSVFLFTFHIYYL